MDLTKGTVTVRTDVAGSAARVGHRLTIGVDDWSAAVRMVRGKPAAVEFRAALDSLQVLSGAGGVTPLTVVDKQVIRRNAAKTLQVDEYPEVTFESEEVVVDGQRIDVAGALTIHGVTMGLDATLTLDAGRVAASIPVRQTDFGLKPYSLLMGQLKVADEVVVDLDVEVPT